MLRFGVALAVLLSACAGASGPTSGTGPSASCLVFAGDDGRTPRDRDGSGGIPSSLSVGITHLVEPENAPAPTSPDEAFLFGLLYEPLLRMDCTGRLYPGLVDRWESDDDGRRWTFRLREGVRFWDGEAVTAPDVAESWRRAEASGRSPWEPLRPLTVAVLDDRRLRVTFAESWSRPPPVLTTPRFGVTRPAGSGPWPTTGAGPYRVAESPGRAGEPGGSDEEELLLRPMESHPGATSESPGSARPSRAVLPTLRVRMDEGSDPRDLLDDGVDLLVTGDPETVEYASLRQELSSLPLPWNRRYVLVLGAPPPGTEAEPHAGFLEGLARDVVREEARPADGPGCLIGPLPGSAPPGGGDATRIGYRRDDPTARALAERLVALATTPARRDAETDGALRALGLEDAPVRLVASPLDADVPASLEPGERARVVGVPRRPDMACRTLESSPGLPPQASPGRPTDAFQRTPPETSAGAADEGRRIPLVDTRRRIVSRTSAPLTLAVDGAGVPFVVGGWRSEDGTAEGGR